MSDQKLAIALIDDLLPQTQCGLCQYPAGCLPYAEAVVMAGEAINLCVPGGQPVADTIAKITGRPPLPVEEGVLPLGGDGRPVRLKARIDEDECIGCAKCLAVCPTDAIVGAPKMLHSIIQEDCTGCELCLPPCPVDCIVLEIDPAVLGADSLLQQSHYYRTLYQKHLKRQAAPVVPVSEPRASVVVTVENEPASLVDLMKLKSRIGQLRRRLARDPNDGTLQAELAALEGTLAGIQETG